MEDEAIVALFLDRDQAALEACQRKNGAGLLRLALRILGNREDAEECVNDSLLAAWNSIPPNRPASLSAYLGKLCRYAAYGKLDWQNAQKRRAQVVELSEELESCIPDPHAGSECGERELARLLERFLESLPREKRLFFIRRYWYQDSIGEIAAQFGTGAGRVKVTLHRVRRELRAFLEKEGYNI